MKKIYSNGYSYDQQKAANDKYRAKQRQQREWVAAVAEAAGIPREKLLTPSNASLVAEILRSTTPR